MDGHFDKEMLNDKNKEDNIKKKIEKITICLYCHNIIEFIWVHGHYQCPLCKNIVLGCCGDE